MYHDRQKYEEKIEKSPLFSLERGTSAYEREMYNMEEYLFCYLMAVNETLYGPWGCEIVETSIRCIRSFDSAQGDFLHYFNAAWKKTYKRLLGRQKSEEQFRGIKISKEDRRNIRNYLHLLETSGISADGPAVCERIAETMDLPVQKVLSIMQMSSVSVLGDTQPEGTDSVWGQIADDFLIEQQILSAEEAQDLLARVETVFKGSQQRQRPLLSDLLTARVCPVLQDRSMIEQFSFINAEMAAAYIQTGVLPTQESIARKYGRDAASVSRTINQFLKKLKANAEREMASFSES